MDYFSSITVTFTESGQELPTIFETLKRCGETSVLKLKTASCPIFSIIFVEYISQQSLVVYCWKLP